MVPIAFGRNNANVRERTETTTGEEQTLALARELAGTLGPGDVIALTGTLGAGKTCFTRGIARGLGSDSYVTSPTFTIMQQYRGRLPVYHFDLYRLACEDELDDLGFTEYFDGEGVCVIEWPEKSAALLPGRTIRVTLRPDGPVTRTITIVREEPA